jgi:hypothetical protein
MNNKTCQNPNCPDKLSVCCGGLISHIPVMTKMGDRSVFEMRLRCEKCNKDFIGGKCIEAEKVESNYHQECCNRYLSNGKWVGCACATIFPKGEESILDDFIKAKSVEFDNESGHWEDWGEQYSVVYWEKVKYFFITALKEAYNLGKEDKKDFKKFGLCGNPKNHINIEVSDCPQCWEKMDLQ